MVEKSRVLKNVVNNVPTIHKGTRLEWVLEPGYQEGAIFDVYCPQSYPLLRYILQNQHESATMIIKLAFFFVKNEINTISHFENKTSFSLILDQCSNYSDGGCVVLIVKQLLNDKTPRR